jgi:hypothetical protein
LADASPASRVPPCTLAHYHLVRRRLGAGSLSPAQRSTSRPTYGGLSTPGCPRGSNRYKVENLGSPNSLMIRHHRWRRAQIGDEGAEVGLGHAGVVEKRHRRRERRAVGADPLGDREFGLGARPVADPGEREVARGGGAPGAALNAAGPRAAPKNLVSVPAARAARPIRGALTLARALGMVRPQREA